MFEELDIIIQQKKELAREHYSNFEKYYIEKNYPKASEFLWGALNDLIYAIGKASGKELSDYTKQKLYIAELVEEYEDTDIMDQYQAAHTLHANFYHNFLTEDTFEFKKEKVNDLIFKLYDILEEKTSGEVEE